MDAKFRCEAGCLHGLKMSVQRFFIKYKSQGSKYTVEQLDNTLT